MFEKFEMPSEKEPKKESGEIKKEEVGIERAKTFLSRLSDRTWKKVLIPAIIFLGWGRVKLANNLKAAEDVIEKKHLKIEDMEKTYKEDAQARENNQRVKAQCVMAAVKNEALIEEQGQENMEDIASGIQGFNFEGVDSTISDITGIEVDDLEQEKIRYIYVVSGQEAKNPGEVSDEFAGADSILTGVDGIWTSDDGILIIAEKMKDAHGKIDKDKLTHTAVHEYIHVLTSKAVAIEKGKTIAESFDWQEKHNLPELLLEGSTEYSTCLVCRERGEGEMDISKLAYDDIIRTALVISEIVDKKVFISDFMNQKIDGIEASFDERVGEGSFQELRERWQNNPQIEFFGATPRSQRALWNETVNFLGEKRIDIGEFQGAYKDLFFPEK